VADTDINSGSGTAGSTGIGRETLAVGGQATIRTTDGDSLNVRSGPGTGFAIVVKAAPGSVVTLLEGPQSGEGYQWWRIRLSNGQEGWAVDSAENEITLVPGAGSFTPPQTSATQSANPSISSALAIGDSAYVSLGRGIDALRLRNQPSTGGGIIQLMPNNTPVTIIGGPTTADGFTWWQLRTPDGNVGWAAEVVGNQRALLKGSAPVSPTAVPGVPPVIVPVTTPEV
jgi:SH3-like domain-containing protein